jgi:hypothetical protein
VFAKQVPKIDVKQPRQMTSVETYVTPIKQVTTVNESGPRMPIEVDLGSEGSVFAAPSFAHPARSTPTHTQPKPPKMMPADCL